MSEAQENSKNEEKIKNFIKKDVIKMVYDNCKPLCDTNAIKSSVKYLVSKRAYIIFGVKIVEFQDTLPTMLTAEITYETQNQGYYVQEDTYTPKLSKQLEAYGKLENIA